MAKKKKKYTRKWMKEPDEFLTSSSLVIGYISEYWRRILIGVAIVSLFLVTAGVIFYYKNKIDIKVCGELARATDLYHKDQLGSGKEQYQQIIKKFPRNGQVWWARLYLAHIYFQERDFEKATELYQEVIDQAPDDNHLVKGIAMLDLASTYEEWDKIDQAIKIYTELSELEDAFFQQQSYIALGRCYEYKGDKEKALLYYKLYLNQPGIEDEALAEKVYRWEAENSKEG
jgi:tetratricopeptide (TPR) repeat protein